ncbi:Bifunctional epoxide hydrolase [Lachnellula suecica]|uniref:Bifunctional epoxide hydrolase n=1 Tax=Lachnellula suecica TaxID=602035 RepID=A0A8T9C503_9HELO|nr:Bifunctional epoxide hydrolase [Lachnellula suecica]
MALNNLSSPGKLLQVQDGTKYAYVHIPATDSKPTFLLLHGFPSSSYDWRFQVKSLSDLGYGVLAPDLLGYGDTDRPVELEKYKWKKMSADLAQILDEEGLRKVIGVGHDWGSGLLSRVYNHYPERFSALVFAAVSYIEPGPFDLDAINAMTEQTFGYPVYGYWKFFNEPDAGAVLDSHNESFTSLGYPSNNEVWKEHLGPIGAAKAWVTSNTIQSLPAWLSPAEAKIHNDILAKGGYTAPLNWYKATIRDINASDDAQIPEAHKFVDVPTLVVVGDEDFITRAELAEQMSEARLRDFKIRKVEGCGHWIQLEKREEFSGILVGFAEKGLEGV